MNPLRRWSSSIVASFDWMISQVENHEALVNAAIREAQESGARARTQLARVKRDGEEMRKKLKEKQEQQATWEERAVRTAELDEKRALECVKRKLQLQKEITGIEEQERRHAAIERQLGKDLEALDERLVRLRQQRNLLRTRQSRAEALTAIQQGDSGLLTEIDDIFERWESRVAECELYGGIIEETKDPLESGFVSEEEECALRDELARLRGGNQ